MHVIKRRFEQLLLMRYAAVQYLKSACHVCVCRIGLVFVVNTDENVDARHDVGVAMYRAFNYIMKHESAMKALSFLTDVRLHTNIISQCNVKLLLLFYTYKNCQYKNI